MQNNTIRINLQQKIADNALSHLTDIVYDQLIDSSMKGRIKFND